MVDEASLFVSLIGLHRPITISALLVRNSRLVLIVDVCIVRLGRSRPAVRSCCPLKVLRKERDLLDLLRIHSAAGTSEIILTAVVDKASLSSAIFFGINILADVLLEHEAIRHVLSLVGRHFDWFLVMMFVRSVILF